MKEIFTKPGEEANSVYGLFQAKEGSQNIATATNIQVLIDLCDEKKPQRILEMGGGIGTITYTLLKNSSAIVDVYEDNKYCQEAIRKNLSGYEARYNLIENYRLLPPNREYDLLVIDGGNGKTHDGGFVNSVWFYINYLKSLQMLYVEGERKLQYYYARKALCRKYLYKIKKYFNDQDKGCSVVICKPSRIFVFRILNFLYWELMLGTMVKMYFKLLWRKFI